MKSQTTVLEAGGLHWATSESVIEKTLLGVPGVLAVEASAVSQTATVTSDPNQTSVAQLVGWVNDCGYHCTGSRYLATPWRNRSRPTPTSATNGTRATGVGMRLADPRRR